jgi:eukaryotic-like serine/threonine-protein kinase
MDTTVSPPVGQLLGGRYHVGSCIARGGMATVFLATDTRLDRVVALKVIHPELSDNAGFVRRFIGEARAAAKLNSPNVVAIYDQGSDAGTHYLAMEYVPGKTLRTLLAERGRLPPRDALDVIAGVLSGLAAAHQAGIAHRDVKPENVLLTAGGQVKVADFGLARAVAAEAASQAGLLIGTAGYLAPEQVTGDPSDARTDVYAVGVMLFELLTGTQPHTGGDALTVARKHVTDPVPAPSSVLPRLPAALDALVTLATNRDPEFRPADAGELLRAVTDVRNGHPIVLRSRVPRQAGVSSGFPAAAVQADAAAAGGAILSLLEPLPAAAPPAAGSAQGSSPGMPSVSDDQLVPDSGQQDPPVHSTMVVEAPDEDLFGNGSASRRDGTGEHRRGRRPQREPEPWPQRLFSRRSGLLIAGGGLLVIVGLFAWWLTAGKYITVPQVHGMTVSTARADLGNAGFSVRTGRPRHSTMPAGEVIRTTPRAGSRVARGATIALIVSLGPVRVAVPNVSGVPLATARAELRQHGLRSGRVTSAVSSTITAGVVLSSNPPAGTLWPVTRPVRLTVSAGPPLPNFVGQQLAAAQAAAAAGHYQINPVTDTSSKQPANQITRQSPAANTPITPGEVVTVYVSAGPPLVAIPDVHDMPLGQAIATLQHAGFNVTINRIGIGGRVDGTTPTGQAPQGSTVAINVGWHFGL